MKQEKLVLQKTVGVERYQVQGQIDRETKHNPFIAVLMLAKEVEGDGSGLTAEVLRKNLLPALPIAASNNILQRLLATGYLIPPKSQDGIESPWAIRLLGSHNGYNLSEMGKVAASKKVYWDQEHGQFEVTVCKNPLISQQLVSIVATRGEKLTGGDIKLPKDIAVWHNVELQFPERNQMIHALENICFFLGVDNCRMVVEAGEKRVICRLLQGSKEIYAVEIPRLGDSFQITQQLLGQQFGSAFDAERNVVLADFDAKQLAFHRSVKIETPVLEGEEFESLTLPDVHFIPIDQKQARLWHIALLVQEARGLFATEADFESFERSVAKRFQPYYMLTPIGLGELKAFMDERGTPFYQRVKFETFQYLNY
jgi:hypothetical protein